MSAEAEIIDTTTPSTPILTEVDTVRMIGELNRTYSWIERYSSVFRFEFSDFISIAEFRAQYANVPALVKVDGDLKWKTLGEAWVRSTRRRQHRDVVYEPGNPPISANCVNLWNGWGCEATLGEIEPWVTLLDYVFAGDIESRKWFEQWAAYPFQYPGTKLHSAVVMWSALQGVGKTLIGETIGRLYGAENFKTISAAELHGSFNGWAKRCQFVLGEENASSDHRADSNRLKQLITGEVIMVNEKFQPLVTLANRMNFFFTSNHPDAFFLETFDRRFFIWELIGERLPDTFYAGFVNWRDHGGGREALLHHFRTLDLSGFDPKGSARVTRAKLEMIDTGRSDLERWLTELRDDPELALNILGREIVTLDNLVRCYNLKGGGRVNTTSVGKALHRMGNRDKRRIKLKMGRPNLCAICRLDHWAVQENEAWVAEYERTASKEDLAMVT